MHAKKLALNGGSKIRNKKFPAYRYHNQKELRAVKRVLDRGILSGYLGVWHKSFYGGIEVNALEKEWAKYFKVKHAIAVNSATSAIYAAVGAVGVGPGDEVIVTPFSMSCSAVAPLVYGAIPVFADIEPNYFCLDPKSVEKRITKYTKAILVVDLFGQPYDVDAINALAKKHNLYVIEDAAQAAGAKYRGKYAGTLGDIGIFSLNVHKHIHTGEGGMVVTDNDKLAERVRLIRNHAEAVIDGQPTYETLVNMVGFNYRMTEVTAAMAREQLNKLNFLFKKRQENVKYLNEKLAKIPCVDIMPVRKNCTHSFYLQGLKYDSQKMLGIHRNKYVDAVKAELMPYELRELEGVKIGSGYVKPLYLQPLYQKRIAYGNKGWPWTSLSYKGKVEYTKGICPVAEKLFEEELIIHELFRPPMTKKDLNDVAKAFEKTWQLKDSLK